MEPYAAADEVWRAALVFARIGAIVLLLPGVGESYVPPRIRLAFALLLALALTLRLLTLPRAPRAACACQGTLATWA